MGSMQHQKKKQHQSDPSWDTYHCDKLNIIEPCLSVWVLGCFYCITYYRDLSRSPMPWSLPESQLLAIPSQSLNVAGEGINHAMEPVWVKQCHKRTIPPVIIFIGDIRKPFPEMGGLWPWKKTHYCTVIDALSKSSRSVFEVPISPMTSDDVFFCHERKSSGTLLCNVYIYIYGTPPKKSTVPF